jgi:hypothetical protein
MAQSRLGNGDELLMFSGRGNHREIDVADNGRISSTKGNDGEA